MKIQLTTTATSLLMAFCTLTASFGTIHAQPTSGHPAEAPVVLNRDQAAAILPPTVFYRGQSAPIQARNSAGLRVADGKLVLMAIDPADLPGISSNGGATIYRRTKAPARRIRIWLHRGRQNGGDGHRRQSDTERVNYARSGARPPNSFADIAR
jgi:hypothetical protein